MYAIQLEISYTIKYQLYRIYYFEDSLMIFSITVSNFYFSQTGLSTAC